MSLDHNQKATEYGRKLNDRLKELGWSQADLARKVPDLQTYMISNYITGKNVPRAKMRAAIARVLGFVEEVEHAPETSDTPSEGDVISIKPVSGGLFRVTINTQLLVTKDDIPQILEVMQRGLDKNTT